MRFPFLLFVPLAFAGCHFGGSEQPINGQALHSTIPPAYSGGSSHKMEHYTNEPKAFRCEANLLSFSSFIYLEDAALTESQLNDLEEIEVDSLAAITTDVYKTGHHPVNLKYRKFIGRTITVNSPDHSQYPAKIKSIVVVNDHLANHLYYAALVDLPVNTPPFGCWANTSSRLNPFPFTRVEDETNAALSTLYLDSLAEYHFYAKKMRSSQIQYDLTETTVFEARKGEKYVLIQHNWIGDCESQAGNYSALYQVTGSGWFLQAEGELDHPFLDLIDIDGDFYPELLMGGISTTAIYEINYKGFSKKRWLTWSHGVCSC